MNILILFYLVLFERQLLYIKCVSGEVEKIIFVNRLKKCIIVMCGGYQSLKL